MQKAWRVAQFITLGFSNFGWRGHKANAKNFTPGTLDVDLTGRHIVVTGATSGLGRVTAVALAAQSATVHLVVRDAERGTALAEELTASGGNAVVHRCDLSSLKDVVEFVQKLNNDKIPVSVLVNNAGAMIHEVKETEDGFEMGFATNTLGTFALTEGIRPLLERTGRETKVTPRVVTVSSAGMLTEDLEIEDLAGKSLHKGEGNLDGAAQYARCKRRQVVLTEYWAERYKDGGIFWASMHPGWASTPGLEKSMPEFHRMTKSQLRSQEQGADTIIYLAASDEAVTQTNGKFFFDRRPVPTHLWLGGTQYAADAPKRLVGRLQEMLSKAGYAIPE